jgi:hypothetical protein
MIPYRSHSITVVPKTMQARLELAKAIQSLTALTGLEKFDPNQPRVPSGNPDGGQWTGGNAQASSQQATRIAARRISPAKKAECEEQYASDKFHCQMVGLPGCYAQAMLRYANCSQGLQIPPLNY